jgi:exopolyphosphatase/guanosine-5'-triphosphate,3'-diphosphate pyrophosphatase
MEKDISDQLDRAQREVPQLNTLAPNSRAIGLAGTVATLAMLEQSLHLYDRNKVHGFVLSDTTIERWYHTLSTESASNRAKRNGMTKGREDVIVGGVAVLDAVVKRFSISSCITSESDILDGVVDALKHF